MNKVDDYICDKFQKLSEWLEDLTGKTCFWFAFLLLIIRSSIQLYGFLSVGWKLVSVVIFFLSIGITFYAISLAESTSSGRINIFRYHTPFVYLRIMTIGATIGAISGIVSGLYTGKINPSNMYAWFSFIPSVPLLYFLSCTSRPGGKRRVNKWIDALADKMFGKLIPQNT